MLFHRQPVQDRPEIRLDIGQFVRTQHALEHVEATAPVGVQDGGMNLAVGGEPDRAAIAQAERQPLALLQIGAHRAFFGPVID
jgi:hypothetical protein